MKFAFSTASRDFPTIAGKARNLGYSGVEIGGAAGESLTSTDSSCRADVRQAFSDVGIEIACLAATVRFTLSNRSAQAIDAEDLRRWIDLAAELNCRRVMVRDLDLERGISRMTAGLRLGEWLAPSADHAAERGVTLLVCNDSSLNSSRSMWTMLERLRHPAVACAWDVLNGARAGESPAVSVPTLNSRIRYARVGDANFDVAGITGCSLGEGDAQIEMFLTRLRGIGYGGYVTLADETTPDVADAALQDAIAKLRRWGSIPAVKAARSKKGGI